MSFTQLPRSVRNQNPGNIESNLIPWAGLQPIDLQTADQRAEQRFCVFINAKMGFRALAVLLLRYRYTHMLTNVEQIIGRYAPPVENATGAYVKSVCDGMGVEPTATLNLNDPQVMTAMCRAIATQESGGWFFDTADLINGVDLALYPTVKGVINNA